MEPTNFSEQGSGNVLVVEIDGAGAEPRIEACSVNSLTWKALDPVISTVDDIEALDAAIQSLGSPESLLLRVSPDLSGCTDGRALERLETLQGELGERAFFLEWTDPVRQPVIGEGSDQIPDGTLSQVDETLATILDGRIPGGPGHQFADRDPEVVQAARMLLHRLAGGRSA